MLVFFKFCFIWLIVGFVCASIGILYDIVINKEYIGKRELKAIGVMILFGFISVPLTVVFLIKDINENKKTKKKNKKFR
jgi:1,4-dihydroxy-2-naphthoate octaprenyltransferase